MKVLGINDKNIQVYIDNSLVTDNVKKLYISMKSVRPDDERVAKSDGTWGYPEGYSLKNVARNESKIIEIKFAKDLTLLPDGFTGCIRISTSEINFTSDMLKITNLTFFAHKINRYASDGSLLTSIIQLQTITRVLILGVLRYTGERIWKYTPIDIYRIGQFALLPYRPNQLPEGWYFRNGDNYLMTSVPGQALYSLPVEYRDDNRIEIKYIDNKKYINVPNAFHSDGRGYYERAVNGIDRAIGSIQEDHIRNITGKFPRPDDLMLLGIDNIGANKITDGAIGLYEKTNTSCTLSTGMNGTHIVASNSYFDFDASRSVPTGKENNVINYGLTPAIYLGV